MSNATIWSLAEGSWEPWRAPALLGSMSNPLPSGPCGVLELDEWQHPPSDGCPEAPRCGPRVTPVDCALASLARKNQGVQARELWQRNFGLFHALTPSRLSLGYLSTVFLILCQRARTHNQNAYSLSRLPGSQLGAPCRPRSARYFSVLLREQYRGPSTVPYGLRA